jgi:hypothetical protein
VAGRYPAPRSGRRSVPHSVRLAARCRRRRRGGQPNIENVCVQNRLGREAGANPLDVRERAETLALAPHFTATERRAGGGVFSAAVVRSHEEESARDDRVDSRCRVRSGAGDEVLCRYSTFCARTGTPAMNRRMSAMAFGLSVTALLADGCQFGHRVTLAMLAHSDLHFALSPDDATLALRIFPRNILPPGSDCRFEVPGLEVTFNNVHLVRRRGNTPGGDVSINSDCMLDYALPPSGSPSTSPPTTFGSGHAGVIRLRDGNTSWSLAIPDALTPRRLRLASPEDGILRPGQEAVVRSIPATDKMPSEGLGIRLAAENNRGKSVTIGKVQVSGDTIRFRVPIDLPPGMEGPGSLVLLGVALIHIDHSLCPVDSCTIEVSASRPSLGVTIGHIADAN